MSSNFNARFPPKPVNKKSIFERQRAEAEAKRQREAAETAAVYEDFVKSFDDDGSSGRPDSDGAATRYHSSGRPPLHPPAAGFRNASPATPLSVPPPQPMGGAAIGGSGGRRHFSMPSSGPGGPPGGIKKRPLPFENREDSARTGGRGSRLAFGDDDSEDEGGDEGMQGDGRRTLDSNASDLGTGGSSLGGSSAVGRAEEKAIAKPTIRLVNLPPGTSLAAVKALVVGGSSLTVDGVRMLPTATSGPNDRKSAAAIVMLATETAASDIDAAVSALQNQYLGYGYYLNLHRHLSSAVVASSSSTLATSTPFSASSSSQPFGAKPVPTPKPGRHHGSSGYAPPPFLDSRGPSGYGRGRGVPPPSTFNSTAGGGGGGAGRDGILHVPVRPPRDIKKLRMIHKVIENVLDQGPEFEALLMSRPEVQRDEKWAWIWDARSEAGVWYRYRLWETVTGLNPKRSPGKYMPLFEGSSAWKVPDKQLPYEFDTDVAELASDSDYDSSDDSDFEDSHNNRPGDGDDNEDMFLNPIEKARLAHLLARLPTTLSKLRKGDIARVTAFAIAHASRGADEIVDMIVSNIERPYAYSAANPDFQKSDSGANANADGDTGTAEPDTTATELPSTSELRDTSGAKLIAVYVVSDILSSSATSGVRHAWRFRQLFETALRNRKVFEGLGLLAEKFNWGRLRADKWKRSIGLVLGHWEGWSVFSAETQEYLTQSFENPPSAKKDEKDKADSDAAAKKGRWKTVTATVAQPGEESGGYQAVDAAGAGAAGGETYAGAHANAEGDGKTHADSEDEWAYRSEYTDDEELDLACLDEEDIDGEPMDDAEYDAAAGLDGIPLTAEEIEALGGDVVEMSEEGEIGSDDDEYEMSGLSGTNSGDNSDGDDNGGGGDGAGSDTEMVDAAAPEAGEGSRKPPADTSLAERAQPQPQPTQAAGALGGPPQTKKKVVGGFQMSTSNVAAGVPRKRMRAVDMFADSDTGGSE